MVMYVFSLEELRNILSSGNMGICVVFMGLILKIEFS